MDMLDSMNMKGNQIQNFRIQNVDPANITGLANDSDGLVTYYNGSIYVYRHPNWIQGTLVMKPMPIAQNVRYVGNYGNYGTPAGVTGVFFTTIQAAIDAAVAGDLIYVYPHFRNNDYEATYFREQININKMVHVHCFPGVVIRTPEVINASIPALVNVASTGATLTGHAVIENTNENDIYVVQTEYSCPSFECREINYIGSGSGIGAQIKIGRECDMKFDISNCMLVNDSGRRMRLECNELTFLQVNCANGGEPTTVDCDTIHVISVLTGGVLEGRVNYFDRIDTFSTSLDTPARLTLEFIRNLTKYNDYNSNTYYPVRVGECSIVELIDGTIETETMFVKDAGYYSIPVLIDGYIDDVNKDDSSKIATCRLKHVLLRAVTLEGYGWADQICIELKAWSKAIIDRATLYSEGDYCIKADTAGSQYNHVLNYYSVSNKDVYPGGLSLEVCTPLMVSLDVK